MCKAPWQKVGPEHRETIEGLLSGEVQNKRRIEDRQEDRIGLGGHQTRGGERTAKSQHLLALRVCGAICSYLLAVSTISIDASTCHASQNSSEYGW